MQSSTERATTQCDPTHLYIYVAVRQCTHRVSRRTWARGSKNYYSATSFVSQGTDRCTWGQISTTRSKQFVSVNWLNSCRCVLRARCSPNQGSWKGRNPEIWEFGDLGISRSTVCSLIYRAQSISSIPRNCLAPQTNSNYLAPGTDAKYCDVMSVCLPVSLSVVRSHSLKITWPNFTNFCAYCLWPWLGPPLATLRCVIFRFCEWCHVFT